MTSKSSPSFNYQSDDNTGDKKIYQKPKHVFPPMAAEHTIEFRRNFRVDDELVRDCHRFQDALLRIDFVFEPHVVIVNRPDASADPCRQPILSAREPLDTMPYPVRRFGSAKRLGWNEEAGTPVLTRNDVQLKLHVQNARCSC